MSETDEHTDDRALAGEYVLGLLAGDELASFEARLVAEPSLRALTRAWAEDLARLAEDVEPVTPPSDTLRCVERKIYGDPEPSSVLSMVRGWLFGGLVMAGLAAVVLFSTDILDRGPVAPTNPLYVADIDAEQDGLFIHAGFDADTGELHIVRREGDARPDRALEIWLIEGGNAPVSLGVLPEERHIVIALNEAQQAVLNGAVIAVSDEPPGGSPTGAPTGDVLGTATLTET